MDRKLLKISQDDRLALQSEITKAIDQGFLVKIEDLDKKIQAELWAAPQKHFVSIAPAFKTDSRLTPARAAWNFSKRDKQTGLSINDLSLTGQTNLNMSSSARYFKASRRVAVGDIEKFYNQVVI